MCFGIILINSKALVFAKKFLRSLVVKPLNLTEGATLESCDVRQCTRRRMVLVVPGALASLRCQHYFVNEVDDGSRRLFGVQLCEKMANVLQHAAGLLGNKTKYFRGRAV